MLIITITTGGRKSSSRRRKYGYLFQGQRYDWQDAPRGQPGFDLIPHNLIHFLQNHDQIANSGIGVRMDRLASPARVRALTAVLLLGPQTPMLFQGQEFGSSSPFYYFADQSGDLVELVRDGRLDFLKKFPSLRDEAFRTWMPIPADRSTFERSKLDWSAYDTNTHVVALHKDLLVLRRTITGLCGGTGPHARALDGSVLAESAFLLRLFSDQPREERILIVNLGTDLSVHSRAEPLLAPPAGLQWKIEWSSEDMRFGGSGRRPPDAQRRYALASDCAVLLVAEVAERRHIPEREALFAWQDEISSGRP